MNSASVDLIATDPPFKKGKDFHATPDSLAAGAKFQDRWSWERDVQPAWLEQIKDDWPAVWEVIDAANAVYMRPTKENLKRPRDEVGSDMGAFLCFMAVRLLEMHRVLKPTGSIYLHCDPTASHYLKAVMDAIFGWSRFLNEVLWLYKTGGTSKQWFGRKHDNLLFYSKSADYTFNPLKEKSYLSHKYGFSNVEILEDENGFYTLVGMRDYWDIPALRGNQPEVYGYPTQKPLALYERILLASSNEGDVVLDPFCGCATTPVIAERLGRQWVGIDIWDKARDAVLARLEQEGLLAGFGLRELEFTDKPPDRDDDGDTAAPYLRVRESVKEPPNPFKSRAAMYEHLLEQHGLRCQGCDRTFDDPRYLELDHNTPRADGGWNHISNRVLLCGPCNKLKSNIYTLSGLRRENNRRGYMR